MEESIYARRGVSAQKEEVHAATRHLDQGLYPLAFCKIYPDVLGMQPDWVSVMHADGAGTKSALAYLYWKETGDISVWRGIAQDAIVMNLDDLICVGIYDQIAFNSTIDRNKKLIPGEVIAEIVAGSQALFDQLAAAGVHITYMGGETADVGDVVRTIAVNGTMTARWPKNKLVTNEGIVPGDVIIGLASYGTCAWESSYNSGIGSNGLTSARHDVLSKYYAQQFPETYEPSLADDVTYIGTHRLTDMAPGTPYTVGQLLLSPTRTFAPVVAHLLQHHFEAIHGLVHCSGGGQTKCLKYIPDGIRLVKDNLFAPPPVFDLIRQSSGAPDREMYQVFNMGCRLEVYCPAAAAATVIATAQGFGMDAQQIGTVQAGTGKSLQLHTKGEVLEF